MIIDQMIDFQIIYIVIDIVFLDIHWCSLNSFSRLIPIFVDFQ